MAYLMKRKINGKEKWVLRWIDYRKGKGKRAERQIVCKALGATNEVLRNKLLREYKEKELKIKKAVELFGIFEDPGERLLIDVIGEYIQSRETDNEIRIKQGGRSGISSKTLKIIHEAMGFFKEFVSSQNIRKCKELTPRHLLNFKTWLQTKPGSKVEYRSVHSVNQTLRNVKTFLNSFKLDTHPPFVDLQNLTTSALKAIPSEDEFPHHFEVKELQLVLKKALDYDIEQCNMTREMHDFGKKYNGGISLKNQPIFPTIVLIMLTGLRKSEALNLRWNNVQLDSCKILVKAQKTGRIRVIPLSDMTHGVVSHSLKELLNIWKNIAKDEFVLPHQNSKKPTELKHTMERFRKKTNMQTLTFQNLRKNFVSFAVSFGIPPSICAYWAGHSPAVAEKNYASYSVEILPGNSVEESMGISDLLQEAIQGFQGRGNYKNLALINWN